MYFTMDAQETEGKKIRGMRYFKVVLKAEDVLMVFSVSLINVSFNFMKLQAS